MLNRLTIIPSILFLLSTLTACESTIRTPDQDEGVADMGTDAPSESLDSGLVACGEPGIYSCSGDVNWECCSDGMRYEFADGPCHPEVDSGVPNCDAQPSSLGCPCATEGETVCRPYQATLICNDGHFQVWLNHVCC